MKRSTLLFALAVVSAGAVVSIGACSNEDTPKPALGSTPRAEAVSITDTDLASATLINGLSASEETTRKIGVARWEVYHIDDQTVLLGLDSGGAVLFEQQTRVDRSSGKAVVSINKPSKKVVEVDASGDATVLVPSDDPQLDEFLRCAESDLRQAEAPEDPLLSDCSECALHCASCAACTAACATCPESVVGCLACPCMVTECFACGYYCAGCFSSSGTSSHCTGTSCTGS